mmetsp:Transcript_16577/g.34190  ORF Transcript_16577/g.34190 Transcript_16577/m.34190 type:complete len:235 (-) Transcript_16577:116-820(-)
MIFSVLIAGTRSFGTSPIGSIHGHPVLCFRVVVDFCLDGRFVYHAFQDKGPTVFFGFRLVVGCPDEFSESLVAHERLVQKEGIHMHHLGRNDPPVEGMLVDVTKGFWHFDFFLRGFGIDLCFDRPVPSFLQNLFTLVLGNIVDGSEGMVKEILFLDFFVAFVKGGPKDVSNAVVIVETDSSTRFFVVFADIDHSFIVLIIWIGMVFQVGSQLVFRPCDGRLIGRLIGSKGEIGN